MSDPRSGQCPILVGPVLFIKENCLKRTTFFASTLVGICPTLANALVFDMDGEEAVVKAFEQQLNSAIHL